MAINTDDVRPLIPNFNLLAARYYEENRAGGLLHIVLDDGNLSDSDIYYCWEECLKQKDLLGLLLCELLRSISIEDRIKIYNDKLYI